MMRGGTGLLLIVALVAMVTMLAASLLQPVTWVRVVTDDGTMVACGRVDEDKPITLEFTHSMFGGFVREVYHLGPDGLLERQRMVTENAAAAEYYATDGEIRHTPEGYEVLASPFVTDRLVVRVDQRGQHRLTIGGITHPLYDQLQASTAVTLEGHRSPLHEVPRMCRVPSAAPVTSLATPAQHGLWSPMPGRVLPGSVT
jgi:hypothetical protein